MKTRIIMMQFKRVLLLVAICVMLPFFANAKVFLVSVGISDYPGKVNDLGLPAKDAQLVTWLYGQNADVKFMELLDTNATKANIIEAMEKIFPYSNRYVIFHFALCNDSLFNSSTLLLFTLYNLLPSFPRIDL